MKKVVTVLLVLSLTAALLAGCSQTEDSVSVQSVSMLMGMGSVGDQNRYAGVVTAGKTVELALDGSLELKEVKVEVGQDVRIGDLLYTYDNEAFLLEIEQLRLEIEGMKNSLTTIQEQIEELEEQRAQVSEENQLGYTLEIETLQADLREKEYNITLKETELETKQQQATQTEVYAEIAGRVTEINSEQGYDNDGSEKPFMTIMETGNLQVKGILNEMNVASVSEGTAVILRSRTTDEVWTGTVSLIDWETQVQSSDDYYSYSDEMTSTSKYYFYVVPDQEEGLFIGQHVYIEIGTLSEAGAEVMLPSYFLMTEDNGDSYVWAAGDGDKLEKRVVQLGDYREDQDMTVILDGLTLTDYVAFPEEGLKAGMPTVKWDETAFSAEDVNEFDALWEDTEEYDTEYGNWYEVVPDKGYEAEEEVSYGD